MACSFNTIHYKKNEHSYMDTIKKDQKKDKTQTYGEPILILETPIKMGDCLLKKFSIITIK